MHIHIAPFRPGSNILKITKDDNNIETDMANKNPTVKTLNNQVVAAYFIKDTKVVRAAPEPGARTLAEL
jgi:hypothetical protein